MKPIKAKNLNQQLQQAAVLAKGASKTQYDRKLHIGRFRNYLNTHNIQIKEISQIKAKYIQGYVEERLNNGISQRTLQNEVAAIKQTLRIEGRTKLADSPTLSNKALGLSGASREGTKVAITNEQYNEIHQQALNKNPALAATIEIARTLGLRGEEAVQSCQSLKTWQAALNNGATTLKVIFGTKGGRPRQTTVIDRERTIAAINNAIAISEQQNGRLIDKPNLKQAMIYWKNHCSAIGLKGQISPHSLRYAYAQDMTQEYINQGYTKVEALAMTSMDLGHGDGRGRYIEHVYSVKSD